jgi:flagellin
MRELAVQGASETLTGPQRAGLNSEFSNKIDELRRLVFATTFNGKNIVSGTTMTVQVGADNDAAHQIDITGANLKSVQTLVIGSSVGSSSIAKDAIDDIDAALDSLNSARANLGSEMNRLQSAMANAAAEAEALSGASSRIFDTDFARETAHMTALQVRSQAGVSALTQAKGMSSSVISLIG